MTHSLKLPLLYLDAPWNHDFYVTCTCGWQDSKMAHDANTRGKPWPNLIERCENVIANHELTNNLLTQLNATHEQFHSQDKATSNHRPLSVAHYLSAPGYFAITCRCGRIINAHCTKASDPRYSRLALANNLRRQFYFHCYSQKATQANV